MHNKNKKKKKKQKNVREMKLKYFAIVKVKLQNVFPWPIFAIFTGFTQCSNPRKPK